MKPRYNPVEAYNSNEFVHYLDWEAAEELKPRTRLRVERYLESIDSDTAQKWAAQYWEWIQKQREDEPLPDGCVSRYGRNKVTSTLWAIVRLEADEAYKLERDARNYYKSEVSGL